MKLESRVFDAIYEVDEEAIHRFRTLLAGDYVEAEELIDVRTPIDGSSIATVPRLRWDKVDAALDVVNSEGRWAIRGRPGEERLEILNRVADLLEKNKDDMARTLIVDAGKPHNQAYGEVNASIDRLRIAEIDVGRWLGAYIPGDWSEHTLESEGFVRREPYGIVLAIIPFNYPLYDAVNKFVYSVIAGNALLLKPPSADPLATLMLARIIEEAGLPGSALAAITMPGSDSDRLIRDPRVHVISLTGSTETGERVLKQAGIKQFILELGGGDPAVVLDDADLDLSAEKICKGITSYSGQRCDAIKLVLPEMPVYDEVKRGIVEELSKIKVGEPTNRSIDMGPLIDEGPVDEMVEAIEDAEGKGCKLLCGGERRGPTYIEPALVEVEDKETLRKLKLYRDEVFAPVSLIIGVEGVDEALEVANGRRYGLDAAVFGKNLDKIRKLIRRLEVGAVYVNEYPRHGIGYYPFGGRKDSGIGREGIGYSIDYVTALKTVVYNYSGRGIWEYL